MEYRITTSRQTREELAFAHRAAKAFIKDPKAQYYFDAGAAPGSLMALPFGEYPGKEETGILVVRLDPDFRPVFYANLVKESRPKGWKPPTQDT